MSSILDALNKLEQEKAQSAQAEQSELDPALTAHDLVGRSVLRDRVTLRVTPMALLVSIGALVITLIVVVVAAAMIISRSNAKKNEQTTLAANQPLTATPITTRALEEVTVQVAPPSNGPETPPQEVPSVTAAPQAAPPAATSTPEPAPASVQPSTDTPQQTLPSPQSSSFVPPVETASSAPAVAPAVVARQPEPKIETPAPSPEVKSEPQASPSETAPTASEVTPPAPEPARETPSVVKEEQEPAPRTRVASAPVEEEAAPPRPTRRTPPAPKATADLPKDVAVDRLPEFTAMEQTRYGFETVKINIMKPADATNPRGSAILSFSETSDDGSRRQNRMRFYEGERIQQSPLRLFKVEKDRVGLEDVRTGDRYQLQF